MKRLYLYKKWNESTDIEDELDWDWEEEESDDHEKLRDNFIWKTKEGKVIKLKNLKTSHIKNIINYVNRYKRFYKEKYDEIISAMEAELKYRKMNENFDDKYFDDQKMIDIVLKPSGEIMEVSEDEFEELNEFFEFEYDKDIDHVWIEDDMRDGILSVLYYFKK